MEAPRELRYTDDEGTPFYAYARAGKGEGVGLVIGNDGVRLTIPQARELARLITAHVGTEFGFVDR